jgi:signal transduction histidine kinase
LFVGESSPRLERLGSVAAPRGRNFAAAQTSSDREEGQWIEAEGEVAFVTEKGGGMELELETAAGRLHVVVVDRGGLSLPQLPHRRLRANGIGRSILSAEGQRILGSLSVLSGADILPSAPARDEAEALSVLTTVDQVKCLRREEAERGYPVEIRGVVTHALPQNPSIVLQDGTKGIFVRGLPTQPPAAPQIGEYWEIEGVTGPGDFAPVVNSRKSRRVGPGQLPEPVPARLDQLMNGSLDTQYVEIQGVVTAVERNRLELLLREGKINLNFPDLPPGSLDCYLRSLIRARGCLFPAWNRETHRLNVGEMNLCSAAICVDEPAPADLFATPRKRTTELLMFDLRAGAFQLVKVAGQVLCARAGECFVLDGANGLRVQADTCGEFQPGDFVEAVGFSELGGPSPILREAVLRKTGHADLPPPQPLRAENWLDAERDATRVRLEGVLVNQRAEQAEQVLELQAGVRTFVARLKHPARRLASMPPGSLLEITGVYAAEGGIRALGRGIDSFELLLDSVADIRVIARPAWLTPPRVLGAVGMLAAILFAATLWAFSLRRQVSAQTAIIRYKAQHEAALEERARIAKDIHDDLGSSLTRIMLLGERTQEDVADPAELGVHARKIVTSARAAVQSLDVIVWAVDPENDTLEGLVGYLNQYANEFFENTPIRCRLEMPTKLCPLALPAELRHHLFLAVKEALNNVLKHSDASEVHVRVAADPATLDIAIEDNGRGFQPSLDGQPLNGNGLKNMRQRIERLGGVFSLVASPGQGTKLHFIVRVGLPQPRGRRTARS